MSKGGTWNWVDQSEKNGLSEADTSTGASDVLEHAANSNPTPTTKIRIRFLFIV
jgi:hypothetical protein